MTAITTKLDPETQAVEDEINRLLNMGHPPRSKQLPKAAPVTTTAAVGTEIDVSAVFSQIKEHNRKAIEGVHHMIEAGKLLSMLKARLPHGQFIKMALSETGLSRSTISRYMQMAANAPRVGHLKSGRDAMETISKLSQDIVSATPAPRPPSPRRPSSPAVVVDAEIVEPMTEKETARLAELEAVIENAIKDCPELISYATGDEETLVVDGTKDEPPTTSFWSMARDFIATLKPLKAWEERQALCDVIHLCKERLGELDKLKGKGKAMKPIEVLTLAALAYVIAQLLNLLP